MFNAFQAIQAGELGRQHKEQRERKNAFATAGEAFGAGDYSGASQALLPHDLGAGMQMAQYGQQQNQMQAAQTKQSERQQAEGALALTDNMLQIPEAQRGEWLMQNWQSFSPYFDNKDFVSFWQESGGDVSDATLQREMATLRTQLGQGAPEMPEAPKPMSPIGKLNADAEAGFMTPEQRDAAIARANAPRQPAAQVNVQTNPTPEQYAESLLSPPQTKGKDPAIVFDADGFARVSPNAQQQGLNKAALKYNDLAAKNALVQDDISRALDHFTAVDESGTRSVREDQNSVGWKAAFADIPIFGGSTEAGTMQSFLTTLQANVGFGELQAMREASPTGGALGQVSEREIAFLQALLGDIEQSRDPDVLMYNLERLQTFMDGRQERFREAFEADYPSLGETIQREQGVRSDVTSLLDKYAPEGG
jgi:hypothetical protein